MAGLIVERRAKPGDVAAMDRIDLSGLRPAGSGGAGAVIDPDLAEWNYGEYEGLTTKQIHEMAPGWLIFRDGCPGGEAPEQVATRVDRVIARARAAEGDVALFAHGHVLRVLAARWIGLPAGIGQHSCWIRARCACSAITGTYQP
jgi:broad specificity phosphatase PhoE